MLPEEKRAKSFNKLFQIALTLGYSTDYLAEREAEIIKEYARNIRKLDKWWKELERFKYIFGVPEIKKQNKDFLIP